MYRRPLIRAILILFREFNKDFLHCERTVIQLLLVEPGELKALGNLTLEPPPQE